MESPINIIKESFDTGNSQNTKSQAVFLERFLPRLDVSSYQSFKNQGYFFRLDKKLKLDIVTLYWNLNAINRQIGTYNLLTPNDLQRGIFDTVIDSVKQVQTQVTENDISTRLKKSKFFSF